ncbi:MAG: hypothetical protein A2Z29_08250 [Chloroflexi bacterium RBG_16_56_11]|nr:MAG: hypothetical protein A2Z29_08250 [Chloroflexi bacterium RBG_16_56_11]
MPPVFSETMLLNIAIGIETRGITFYDIMAKSSDSEAARTVFKYLVEMEREHLQTFRDLLGRAEEGEDRETLSEGRVAYLQTLVDSAVFTDDLITGEMATQADSDVKALELALSAEKDAILFYYEIRDDLPQRLAPAIKRILAEEKSHLQHLSDVKKRLASA